MVPKTARGALSVIGAVSPPGGDISEPVSQATLRIVKVFWGLDSALAYKRHFPAINWLNSYSLYLDSLSGWYAKNVNTDWMDYRKRLMRLLQDEAELDEIVKLVGMDALSASDRLKMEAARSIREDFLQQDSFDDVDTYTSMQKQLMMMKLILAFYDKAGEALTNGADINTLAALPVRERIGRFKVTGEKDKEAAFAAVMDELDAQLRDATGKGEM